MINISQAKKYCREDISLIKNYAEAMADTTQMWICHHINGEPFTGFTQKDLSKFNMYYDRPACELKFVTLSEHTKIHCRGIHNPMYGRKHTDATKKKISENNAHAFAGKQHTDAVKAKISASMKGKNKGRIPWNKGVKRG